MSRRGINASEFSVEPAVLKRMRIGTWFDGGPMTQWDAAALIGVSRETWCYWETGRRGMAREYLKRFIELTEGKRMWEPVYTQQPQELYVSAAPLVPRKAVHHPGPGELDVCAPMNDAPVVGGPVDLTLPDASELEAPELGQDEGDGGAPNGASDTEYEEVGTD